MGGLGLARYADRWNKGYKHVEVFCAGTACRNNISRWHTRQIKTGPRDKGFRFDATNDRVMAREADFGLLSSNDTTFPRVDPVTHALRETSSNARARPGRSRQRWFAKGVSIHKW
jgi:hypothetical protein